MKKIGIITFHRALNYGAVLQAFALQEYLSKYNTVKILDYRCVSIEDAYNPKSLSIKQRVVKFLASVIFFKFHFDIKVRDRKYKDFSDRFLYLTDSLTGEELPKLNQSFDYFVAGSDQIWNPEYTNFDKNYFLAFTDNDKKISYAASFGKADFDSDILDFFKENLLGFRFLSLREKTGKQLVQEITNRYDLHVVCDPVFLLSKRNWVESLSLSEKSQSKKEEFIFIYCVQEPELSLNFARSLAKKENLKIIYVNQVASRKRLRGIKTINNIGPIDFLNMLLNAKYVVTTSFHGLAFSLIFNKPVFFELSNRKNNKNTRIENLAEDMGINGRQIKDSEYLKENESFINWEVVNNKIEEYRRNSKSFLKMCGVIDEQE